MMNIIASLEFPPVVYSIEEFIYLVRHMSTVCCRAPKLVIQKFLHYSYDTL